MSNKPRKSVSDASVSCNLLDEVCRKAVWVHKDGKKSKLLENLLSLTSQLSDPKYSPGLFASLLFAVMLDYDFLPIHDNSNDGNATVLPSSWKAPTEIYKCKFKIVGYDDCCLLLVATVSEDLMLVNLISQKTNSVFCQPYSISRYIPVPDANTMQLNFECFQEVKIEFQNDVINPARSEELVAAGFANGSIIGLPDEIIWKIMVFSGGISTSKLAQVCRRFRSVAHDNSLWHMLLSNDYSAFYSTSVEGEVKNWYEEYKECHYSKYTRRRAVDNFQYAKKSRYIYMGYYAQDGMMR